MLNCFVREVCTQWNTTFLDFSLWWRGRIFSCKTYQIMTCRNLCVGFRKKLNEISKEILNERIHRIYFLCFGWRLVASWRLQGAASNLILSASINLSKKWHSYPRVCSRFLSSVSRHSLKPLPLSFHWVLNFKLFLYLDVVCPWIPLHL